jgi:hypothetical protein
VTRESIPKNGQVQLRGACACILCLLNHRIHKLSICNAVPYRLGACMNRELWVLRSTLTFKATDATLSPGEGTSSDRIFHPRR